MDSPASHFSLFRISTHHCTLSPLIASTVLTLTWTLSWASFSLPGKHPSLGLKRWERQRPNAAVEGELFVIPMLPPNVRDVLHIGHAMEDIVTKF